MCISKSISVALLAIASYQPFLSAGCSSSQGEEHLSRPAPTPTGEAHVDDIRYLRWVVEEKWSWLEMRQAEGLDLDALEAEALAKVRADTSVASFVAAAHAFAVGLKDGHGDFELEGFSTEGPRQWPFRLREVADGIVIDGYGSDSFMTDRFLRGDRVVTIEGRPVEDWIREAESEVFASNDTSRRFQAVANLGESTQASSVRIRLLRMGQEDPIDLVVSCPTQDEPVPHLSYRIPVRGTTMRRQLWGRQEHSMDPMPDAAPAPARVGYFDPATFIAIDISFATAPAEQRPVILARDYDQIRDAFASQADARAMVLDLRGNGGGTDLIGQALAGHLLKPGYRYYSLSALAAGKWSKPSWDRPDVGHGVPKFRGKLAVLINEASFSATDNLACCLRDQYPDVIFVGQPTGGGSGAPRIFELPSTGAKVRFCTMRVFAPNGEPVEGKGVRPDIAVRQTAEQYRDGFDAVLEAALKALQ